MSQFSNKIRLKELITNNSMILVIPLFFNVKSIDYGFLILLNYLVVATLFSFLLNDYYDREVDKLEEDKRKRNFFSSDLRLDKIIGLMLLFGSFFLTLLIPVLSNQYILLIFTLIILYPLGFGYCHPMIRLRNRLIIDWVIHSIWPVCVFYLVYQYFFQALTAQFFVLVVFGFFFGIYAQIGNQLRDFSTDRNGKVINTSQYLGRERTIKIQKFVVIIIFILFITGLCYLQGFLTIIAVFISLFIIIIENKDFFKAFKTLMAIWIIFFITEKIIDVVLFDKLITEIFSFL